MSILLLLCFNCLFFFNFIFSIYFSIIILYLFFQLFEIISIFRSNFNAQDVNKFLDNQGKSFLDVIFFLLFSITLFLFLFLFFPLLIQIKGV